MTGSITGGGSTADTSNYDETTSHALSDPVTAADGCIYVIPSCAGRVLRLSPNDESISYIGTDIGDIGYKWCGAVLGADGNIYGVRYTHIMIVLKIDDANQSTSLVGPDLRDQCKY